MFPLHQIARAEHNRTEGKRVHTLTFDTWVTNGREAFVSEAKASPRSQRGSVLSKVVPKGPSCLVTEQRNPSEETRSVG